jgi:hypothetical protein
MKTLIVKCLICEETTCVPESMQAVYDTKGPFIFDINCDRCCQTFNTKDTHEADYHWYVKP